VPTPAQINQALLNHRRPPRTNGGKVRDALAHVKNSREDYVENRPVGDPVCLLEYPHQVANLMFWDGRE
jgi:hypothetical protein